ncbi:response regulator [Streptomyces spongiae]|uniref:Response regulator n=1 Tax=Streptomyces spongiae TaxID=565072 RepID=A0A5N8XZB8_9ACTN|nr:response regulator [Streptomyces spongiae]
MPEHSATSAPHKLLVVEDEESIRTLLASTLRLSGYEVASADSGRAALLEIERSASRRGRLRHETVRSRDRCRSRSEDEESEPGVLVPAPPASASDDEAACRTRLAAGRPGGGKRRAGGVHVVEHRHVSVRTACRCGCLAHTELV